MILSYRPQTRTRYARRIGVSKLFESPKVIFDELSLREELSLAKRVIKDGGQ